MKTMKVESREYKLLINHEPFVDPSAAVKGVWDEIEDAAQTLALIRTKGKLDEKEARRIIFLDTPGHTLRRSGLVLRQRGVEAGVEYTLKCRSEDRYFAAGSDVKAAAGLKGDQKLEEDIAPPFRCRFSHSTTITVAGKPQTALETPRTVGEASSLFPVLDRLRVNGMPCPRATPLETVNSITIDEIVWKGGKVVFELDDEEKSPKATVALILWARGKQARPRVAELSFRIKDSDEQFSHDLAHSGRQVYEMMQRLDCARPEGMTKTEYIYRDASRD
jgi:hypothetical protein